MTDLSVFFAGTAGSVPTARRGLPAVLVRRGAERLLFDCGEGTQRQLLRSVGLADLDYVFLTHHHVDHWLGLLGMVKSFALRDRDRPLTVYGPPGTQQLLKAMGGIDGDARSLYRIHHGWRSGGGANLDRFQWSESNGSTSFCSGGAIGEDGNSSMSGLLGGTGDGAAGTLVSAGLSGGRFHELVMGIPAAGAAGAAGALGAGRRHPEVPVGVRSDAWLVTTTGGGGWPDSGRRTSTSVPAKNCRFALSVAGFLPARVIRWVA